MKYSELNDLTREELGQKEAGLRDELFKLRFRQATTQLENPMRIREIRRDIARIQTAQRALAAPTPAVQASQAPAKGGS
jgi:large subunit ribosomal protein L29